MQSNDWITVGTFALGLANVILNLRLQLQAHRIKRWALNLMAEHLDDWHGVKAPRDVEVNS